MGVGDGGWGMGERGSVAEGERWWEAKRGGKRWRYLGVELLGVVHEELPPSRVLRRGPRQSLPHVIQLPRGKGEGEGK